jgi:hypothetical protein
MSVDKKEKNAHSFLVEKKITPLSKRGVAGKFFNLRKAIYKDLTASIKRLVKG